MPPSVKPKPLTGWDIAKAGLAYQGEGYTFGGRADRPGDWDCSSFISYVLGHDLGLVLPGGGRYGDPGYPPNAHGPVVVSYYGWAGATQLPAGQLPAAGDLCVWNGLGPLGHIGIATGAGHMVSALNHHSGTVQTPITGYGPGGAPLTFHRLNGAGQVPGGSGSGSAGDIALAMLAGLSVPVVMTAVIFAAAAVAAAVLGAAATAALAWAAAGRQ